jgi:tetratricopeptide (TPR) repeat protein
MSRTPEQLQAEFERCAALQRANRLEEAAAGYGALLAEAPQVAQIHYNLGLALKGLGRHDAAAQSFRQAVRLRPNWAEAFVNLANALQQMRQFVEAERCSRQALRLNPDLPEALFIHGALLRDLGRFEAAATTLGQAVRRRPALFAGHHNLGMALRDLGRLEQAEAAYRAALAIEPDNPVTQLNLGMLHLLAGRLAEGWEGLEYRWKLDGAPPRRLNTPLWDGRPLPDGTLLIWAEQGLGDTLEFCRYVPLAAERARATVLVATPETRRLLTTLHPAVPVIGAEDGVPAHDVQCPIPSLPRAFGTTLDTVPGTTPYLRADPEAAGRWRERLAGLGGLRVGLVWAGNAGYAYDRFRSVPFAMFTRLLGQPGVSFVSLQKGPPAAELRALPAGARVHDWTDELADMADTAALVDGLDLVISVDTSVVHLTGALGKPVWMLNRFDSEWRWMLGRDDSPWYPTLRQFRQSQPGDWADVFARVAAALAELVGPPRLG